MSPYESLHVAYYTILRGKHVTLAGTDHHPEYDAIYLGFSVRLAVRCCVLLLLLLLLLPPPPPLPLLPPPPLLLLPLPPLPPPVHSPVQSVAP